MRYASAVAFRRALEDRLKVLAIADPTRLARDRKRIAFDRLLARMHGSLLNIIHTNYECL